MIAPVFTEISERRETTCFDAVQFRRRISVGCGFQSRRNPKRRQGGAENGDDTDHNVDDVDDNRHNNHNNNVSEVERLEEELN